MVCAPALQPHSPTPPTTTQLYSPLPCSSTLQPHSLAAPQPCSPITLQLHSQDTRAKGALHTMTSAEKPQQMPRLDLVPSPGPVTAEPWSCANPVVETVSPWMSASSRLVRQAQAMGVLGRPQEESLYSTAMGSWPGDPSHSAPSPALPPRAQYYCHSPDPHLGLWA